MLELVALLVVLPLLAVRRGCVVVVPAAPAFVLPAIDAPAPRRRLARGSVEQPLTPLDDDLPRRPLIRPSHARR